MRKTLQSNSLLKVATMKNVYYSVINTFLGALLLGLVLLGSTQEADAQCTLTLICQSDTTVYPPYPPATCTEFVSWTDPVVVAVGAGCGPITVTQITSPFNNTLINVGVYTIVYLADDGGGNTATCSFVLTVADTVRPTITGCPPDMVMDQEADTCGAHALWLAPVASDACGIASFVPNFTSGSFFPVGVTVVTYLATDVNGNTNLCSFTVTVNDTVPPLITFCPNDTTVNNDPGVCEAFITIPPLTWEDDCATTTTVTNSHNAGGADASGTYPVGVTVVTFTVDDGTFVSTCSNTVTVIDNEPPTITCPADVVTVNDPGVCGADVTLTPIAADNCSVIVTNDFNASVGGFTDFFDVGLTTVTFTATDPAGNTATCSVDVTISDTEDPVITCPADIIVGNDAGLCSAVVAYSVTSTDNCPGDVTSLVSGLPSGSVFPLGTTVNVWIATDVAGNTSTCSFSVTVNDTEGPTFTNCVNVVQCNDAGLCTAVVSWAAITATDNCPGVVTITQIGGAVSGSIFPVGSTLITYQAVDVAGNTSICNFFVIVNDCEDPVITCPADVNIPNDPGICGAVVIYGMTVTDNCPGVNWTQIAGIASGSLFPIGTTTNIWRATDASGNTATCSFDVTVTDIQIPIIICAPNLTITTSLDGTGDCATDYIVPLIIIDNCPVTLNALGINLGTGDTIFNTTVMGVGAIYVSTENYPYGVNTVIYTVTDPSGNTAMCIQSVTVDDDELPTISCPGAIVTTTDLDTCGAVINMTVSGTDNCSYTISNDFNAQTSNNASLDFTDFLPSGLTTVTFTVTDTMGNTATCSVDVTINDNQPPTVFCPQINDRFMITNFDCWDIVGWPVPAPPDSLFDNCPGIITLTETSGNPNPGVYAPGIYTIGYMATDGSGNTATCSTTFEVIDNIFPTWLTCPNDTTVPYDPVLCGATVIWTAPLLYDNCVGAFDSSNYVPGDFFVIGTTEVIYVGYDSAGNTDTCRFFVTVVDNVTPSITCPADITVGNDVGFCGAIVTVIATASDDCGIADTFNSYTGPGLNASGFYPVGTTVVTFTVVDSTGNSATCSMSVTVNDVEPPTVTCPADITLNNDAGICGAVVAYVVTSADNCPGVTQALISGLASGSVFPVGTTLVVWMATDVAGNTATCSFNVTVNDIEPPVIICPNDLNINNDPGVCEATVFAGLELISATDNCQIMDTTNDYNGLSEANDTYPVGITTVVYTVTDTSGNTTTCSFTVTVNDVDPPVLTCQNDTTINNDPGVCGAFYTNITTVFENCDLDTTWNTFTGDGLDASGVYPVGSTTVTFFASDTAGNSATCSVTITVLDIELPVITCPNNINIESDPGLCSAVVNYHVSATDNCPGVAISLLSGLASGSVFPVGVTTNVWMATDASGNTSTCSFTVNVVDREDPVIICPADIVVCNDPGLCSAIVIYGLTVTDNCPGVIWTQILGIPSGSAFPVGTTRNVWQATDAEGNSSRCSFNVTVLDCDPPTITCTDVTFENDPGKCYTSQVYTEPTFTDNCPGAFLTLISGPAPGDTLAVMGPVTPYVATWMVTDIGGNTATCSMNIFVIDTEAPTTTCPTDIVQGSDPGQCGAVVLYIPPFGADNCIVASVVQTDGTGLTSGDFFPVGVTQQSYLVTDFWGNTTTCGFTVTVDDTEDPVVVCPADITQDSDPGVCEASVTWTIPTPTDNCPGVSIAGTHTPGDIFPVGTTTVVYTATDAAGNTASCSFDITVEDNEAPSITCPPSVVTSNDPGLCSAVVTYAEPTTSDNCPTVEYFYGFETGAQGWTTGTLPGSATNFWNVNNSVASSGNNSYGNTNDGLTFGPEFSFIQSPPMTLNGSIVNFTFDSYINNASGIGFNIESVEMSTDNGANWAPIHAIPVNDLHFPVTSQWNAVSFTAVAGPAGTPTLFRFRYDVFAPAFPPDPGIAGWYVDNVTVSTMTPIPVLTAGLPTGSAFPVGTTTNVYMVTDGHGNTATCSFDVTVNDTENPVISGCPADIAVNNDAGVCEAIVSWTPPTATDNCPGVILTSTHNPGDTFPVGLTTVVYTATDVAGNMTLCSFNITVTDNEDPVITCPADITVNNDAGVCGAVVTYADATATDNCPGVSVFQSGGLPSGSTFPVGTTTVSYLAIDAFGNDATCSFDVTVVDNEPPVVTCNSDVTLNNDPGQCGAIYVYSMIASDNCPGMTVTLTGGLPSGSLFPVGSTVNTWNATDASGNMTTCSFTVTVNDVDLPVITCPADITVNSDLGLCSAIVTYAVTATDNCPGVTVGLASGSNWPSGSAFPVGTTSVSWIATDASGNTATCSFNVTVNDNELPVLSPCPANINTVSTNIACGASVVFVAPTATDNCPGVVVTSTHASGSEFPVGSTTVVFTATDASGNTTTCSFVISVADTFPPTITCPPDVLTTTNAYSASLPLQNVVVTGERMFFTFNGTPPAGCDAVLNVYYRGDYSFPSTEYVDVFGDDLSFLGRGTSQFTFDCSLTYDIISFTIPQATVTAWAANGSIDIEVQNGPGVNTFCASGDIFVDILYCDANAGGLCEKFVTIDPPTINDNCFAFDVTADPLPQATGDATLRTNVNGDLGSSVEWFDFFGEAGYFVGQHNPSGGDCVPYPLDSFVIPMAVINGWLADNAVDFVADATASVSPFCVNNDVDIVLRYPHAGGTAVMSGGPSPLLIAGGTIPFTLALNPVFTPNMIATNDYNGTDDASDIYPVGTTTVVWTVVDPSGNSATCSMTVTVEDKEAPVLSGCPTSDSLNNDAGLCGAIATFNTPTATDNCGIDSIALTAGLPSGSLFPVGVTTNTFTVWDVNGNTADCSFDITVFDVDGPTIACVDSVGSVNDTGRCDAQVSVPTPGVTDNCTWTLSNDYNGTADASDNYPVGSTTVVWTVVDEGGNTATCSTVVTVTDTELPVIACPSDTVLSNDTTLCGAVVIYPFPTASDNCPGVTITLVSGLGPVSIFPVGTTTNVFMATDAAGNTTTCSFDVTVIDTERPVIIVCPSDVTVGNDRGDCSAVVTWNPPIAVDNCGNVTFTFTHNSGDVFPVGTTTVTITASDDAGNTSDCSFDVTVEDTEDPEITGCPADIASCDPTITWTAPTASDNCGVVSFTSTHNSGDVFPIGTTAVVYTATDAAGNVSTCGFDVTIHPLPTADAGADTDVCIGSTVTIGGNPTGSGTTGGYTYSWSPAAGLTSTVDANPGASPVATTTYTVVVTDLNGCTDEDEVTVTVNPLPTADAGADQTICVVGSVQIGGAPTGSGTVGPYSYSWAPAGGLSSTTAANPTASPAATTTYTVTVTDANGCVGTASMTVNVNPLPDATINAAGPFCANAGDQTLTAATPGGTWSGTGITNAAAGTFNPAAAGVGVHTITYDITDANGCSNSSTIDIEVLELPGGQILPAGPFCENDDPVFLTGLPNINPHTWVGAGTDPQTGQFDPTAAGPGNHDILYIVTNALGCTDTGTATITVIAAPVVAIIGVGPYCELDPVVTLQASVPGGIWTGPGIIQPQLGEFLPIAAGAGVHEIKYTVSNTSGCITTESTLITVNEVPSVSGVITQASCIDATDGGVDVTVSGGTPPYTYAWSGGNPPTQDLVNVAPGVYTVTVTDQNSCSQVESYTVGTSAQPVLVTAVITQATNAATPNGAIVTTVTGGVPPYSFAWSNSETTQSISNLLPGTYDLTILDAAGCSYFFSYVVPARNPIGGIDLTDLENSIKLYPNPTNSVINIDIEVGNVDADMTIEVFDVLGRKVYQMADKFTNRYTTIISMDNWASGHYMVRFDINGQRLTKKVVLTK